MKKVVKSEKESLLSQDWFRTVDVVVPTKTGTATLWIKELNGEQQAVIRSRMVQHRDRLGLTDSDHLTVELFQHLCDEWSIRSLIDSDGEFMFATDEDVDSAAKTLPPTVRKIVWDAVDELNVITITKVDELKKKLNGTAETGLSTTQNLAVS